jgi:hypothetical protein
MKAGFFNLFRWGRYGGSGHPSALNDDTRHEERERFAVAAVAFCLTHHKEFRQHFLRNCCKLQSDASLDEIPHIAVEDKKWGDLAVWQPGQWAYVLEFKLGDGSRELEDHQNPDKPQFWEQGTKVGYGSAICRAKKDEFDCPKRCKYIVLGWEEKLNLNSDHSLEFDQLQWKDLVPPDLPCDEILEDLWECLGFLGVPEFQLRRFKGMKLQSSTKSAAQMFKLLEGLAVEFKLDGRKDRWNVGDPAGEEYMGVNIPSGGKFTELSKCVGDSATIVGWYGYETPTLGSPRITIWLYSAEPTQRDTEEFVKEAGLPTWKLPNDFAVYITREPRSELDDASWFRNVLSKLSDKTNRS